MKYVLIGAVIITIIFLGVLYFIPLGIEPLTELYFEDHTSLPKHIFLDKPYNFSFTVNNLEYQDMKYNYDVSIEYPNKTYEIDSGEIFLSNNESKTIYEVFTLRENFERAKIQIKITKDHLNITPEFKKKFWWPDPNYPNEINIHLWIEEIVGTTITIIPD